MKVRALSEASAAWRGGYMIADVLMDAALDSVKMLPFLDRADLLAIAFFVVRDKFFISPVLPEVSDQRKLVDPELLVFGGMGIIKSPLLERDISADKI